MFFRPAPCAMVSILLAVQQPCTAPPHSNAAGQDGLCRVASCAMVSPAWQSAAQQRHNALHHSTKQQGLVLQSMPYPVGLIGTHKTGCSAETRHALHIPSSSSVESVLVSLLLVPDEKEGQLESVSIVIMCSVPCGGWCRPSRMETSAS
jgi:hypothetical protein